MLYSDYDFETIYIHRVCQKLRKVSVCGEVLVASKGYTNRNSCVSAFWKSPSDSSLNSNPELRFGHIQYFLNHYMRIESSTIQHIIAIVNWYNKHPQEMYFGSSSYVVCNDVEEGSSFCYILVQRFASQCGFGVVTIHPESGEEDVTVAIPIPLKFCV